MCQKPIAIFINMSSHWVHSCRRTDQLAMAQRRCFCEATGLQGQNLLSGPCRPAQLGITSLSSASIIMTSSARALCPPSCCSNSAEMAPRSYLQTNCSTLLAAASAALLASRASNVTRGAGACGCHMAASCVHTTSLVVHPSHHHPCHKWATMPHDPQDVCSLLHNKQHTLPLPAYTHPRPYAPFTAPTGSRPQCCTTLKPLDSEHQAPKNGLQTMSGCGND